jgi:hypothetical protein
MPPSKWWYQNHNSNGTAMKYDLSPTCIDRLEQELSQVDEELQLSGVGAKQRSRALEGHAASMQRAMNNAFEAGKSRSSALAMVEDLTTDTLEAIIQGDAHFHARAMAAVSNETPGVLQPSGYIFNEKGIIGRLKGILQSVKQEAVKGVKSSGEIPQSIQSSLEEIDRKQFFKAIHNNGKSRIPAREFFEILKSMNLTDASATQLLNRYDEGDVADGFIDAGELSKLLDELNELKKIKNTPNNPDNKGATEQLEGLVKNVKQVAQEKAEQVRSDLEGKEWFQNARQIKKEIEAMSWFQGDIMAKTIKTYLQHVEGFNGGDEEIEKVINEIKEDVSLNDEDSIGEATEKVKNWFMHSPNAKKWFSSKPPQEKNTDKGKEAEGGGANNPNSTKKSEKKKKKKKKKTPSNNPNVNSIPFLLKDIPKGNVLHDLDFDKNGAIERKEVWRAIKAMKDDARGGNIFASWCLKVIQMVVNKKISIVDMVDKLDTNRDGKFTNSDRHIMRHIKEFVHVQNETVKK